MKEPRIPAVERKRRAKAERKLAEKIEAMVDEAASLSPEQVSGLVELGSEMLAREMDPANAPGIFDEIEDLREDLKEERKKPLYGPEGRRCKWCIYRGIVEKIGKGISSREQAEQIRMLVSAMAGD